MAGRPTDYNEEIAARICSEVASGRSLRSVVKDDDIPAMSSVFLWIAKYPIFSEQYAQAQSDRTVAWSEDLVEIADDASGDTQRDKLRVDTRKWLMSKMAPKRYGDKIETVHSGGIEVQQITRRIVDPKDK